MSRMCRAVVPALALGALLALWAVPGQAGGDKAPGWKPFLPPDVYKELTRRSLERIGMLARTDTPIKDLRAEAVTLAGYTISTKDAASTAGLREQALKVAALAADKDGADKARKLAMELAKGKAPAKAAGAVKDWPAAIGDLGPLMMPLASKAKGGEGIAADLQYNAKLKNQNGIEALMIALAIKKLPDATLGKMSKELELLGYRVATIGALTLRHGPSPKKRDETPQWNKLSIDMRDSAIDLAHGARKKDGAAVLDASKRLVNSCVECHADFK